MAWEINLQSRLTSRGLYSGRVDGLVGPRTLAGLFRFCGARDLAEPLAQTGNIELRKAGILDSALRAVEWFAENAHESQGFTRLREIWGPTPAQLRYQGRVSMENTQPGDGFRFRGRGIIQLTGRKNYRLMSSKLGIDLVGSPELAEKPEIAMRISCQYWLDNGLNILADRNQSLAISIRINGKNKKTGLPNGLEDRNRRKTALRGLML